MESVCTVGRGFVAGRRDLRLTGLTLDHDHVRTTTLLAIIPTDTAPIERMPSVVHFHLFTDMGRMTQQLLWAGSLGCSADLIAAANVRLPCTASSSRPR